MAGASGRGGAVTVLARVKRYDEQVPVDGTDVALSELPDFVAYPGTHPQRHHSAAIAPAPSLDHLEEAFQQARRDEAATRSFSGGSVPSFFERTVCRGGQPHHEPVRPLGADVGVRGARRSRARALRRSCHAGYAKAALNLPRSILHREVIGPYDMEHTFGLIGAYILHGALSLDQLFHSRPAVGHADDRTPVGSLYQASSATHRGGVCGPPAWQAARAVLADRCRAKRHAR